jgi:hypothetical protein
VLGGVSSAEFAFVALLLVVVVLAPLAPRIGERIGGLFEKSGPDRGAGAD